MKNTHIRRTVLFFLVCVLLLSACSVEDNSVTGTDNAPVQSFEPFQNETETQYREIRYSVLPNAAENDIPHSSATHLISYGVGARYTLSEYMQSDGNYRYILEKRLSDLKIEKTVELFEDETDWFGSVLCMDVVSNDNIALLIKKKQDTLFVVRIDENGEILSQTDVSESYAEQGILISDLVQNDFRCDSKGYQYVFTEKNDLQYAYKLTIFDENGQYIRADNYNNDKKYYFNSATHNYQGALYIARTDAEHYKTEWISADDFSVFLDVPEINRRQLSFLENGDYYYSSGERLWFFAGKDNSVSEIYHYPANDIQEDGFQKYVNYVSITEEDELLLYVNNGINTEIYALSANVPETKDGIRLVDLCDNSIIQRSTVGFNRSSDVKVDYKTYSYKNSDVGWNRTMAELASGNGPDIICVGVGQDWFHILAEKDVLEDLSDMIPAQIEEQIFPGILERGSIDGKWLGVIPSGTARVLITANSVYEGKQWTTEDIIKLAEKRENLSGIFLDDSWQRSIDATSTFDFMTLHHMQNSSFLNMQTSESYFDSEIFQKVLEYAKQYSENTRISEDEKIQLIRDGQVLAGLDYVFNAGDFVQLKKRYGDSCHIIGYPGQEEGYAGYWESTPIVLVNNKSKYKEEIADYLQYLLSKEYQTEIQRERLSVREDVIRDSEHYLTGYGWIISVGENVSKDFTKEDGSSYMEDYIAFLRGLSVETNRPDALIELIATEAESYFAGDKTAKQVADIIDNRVQLYLDEQ